MRNLAPSDSISHEEGKYSPSVISTACGNVLLSCLTRIAFHSQVIGVTLEVVRKEHERFQQRLSRVLKGSLGPASNRSELQQHIRKIGDQLGGSADLGELAVTEFSDALNRLGTFKQKRTSGIRGVNKVLQDSIFAFCRFAAAYSNVLEAVSHAAGPYTEIGYQTMTILLFALVNKKTNDDRIEAHFVKMQKSIPRLEVWKGIYGNQKMEELVSAIYHLVIKFSRSAAEYFCSRWKRVWLAVNPLANQFDEIAQDIYEALAEVNAEANQGLHARSQRMERTLEEMKSRLEKQDEAAQKKEIRKLEKALSLNSNVSSHPCFKIELAKETLKAAFPNSKECSTAIACSMYTLMTPARILSHHCLREWADSKRSALLFIHGLTRREGRASSVAMPCWLSPAAIHISEHIHSIEEPGPTQDRIIYFSCKPDREKSIDQAAVILAMLGLKLLSTSKDIPRERLTEFQGILPSTSPVSSHVSSQSWSRRSFSPAGSPTSSPEQGFSSQSSPVMPTKNSHHNIDHFKDTSSISNSILELRSRFLKEVLEELSRTEAQTTGENGQRRPTAYLILDRLDSLNDVIMLKKFLRELVCLIVENDAFCVKIVAVAEVRLQENNWKNSLPQKLNNPDQVFEIKMDQQELSLMELAREKQQLLWKD